jgi:malonyl-CoA/methylmalonyl-CoA synthetase
VLVSKPGAKLNSDAMNADLKGKIANFKVPKKIIIVSELPRNAMGKVQKNILRQTYA